MASIKSPFHVRKNLGGPFKESEHPRDHGQFAEKPGASGEAKKPAGDKTKRAAPGSQLPEPQKNKLRDLGMTGTFPPADVPLSSIKFADLSKGADELKFVPLMSWNQNTGSGRVSRQYRYTQAFHDRNAAEKFDRVMEVEPTLPAAKKKLAETMASGSPRDKEGAAIASIIMETGLRPTDSDESVKHGHYGVGSILAKHVSIDGDVVKLDFIGKEGVRNKAVISDVNSVKYLKDAITGKDADEPVFPSATSQDALDQLKEATGLKDAKLKDLRTIRATQEARKVVDEFEGPPPPLSGDEKKDAKAVAKAILAMSGKVAIILNNTALMARDNYVHPEVWKTWQKKLTSEKTTKTMSRIIRSPLATTSSMSTYAASGRKPSESSQAKALASSPLYRRKSAQFDESKHPRADDGKFGTGSSSPSRKPIAFIPHRNQRNDETTIVVDPKKIDESWKKVEDEYLPPSGDGKSEVPGRRAGVEAFLKKEKPVEASRMIIHDGEVSFIDGRHRMAVMRDRGESRMAVTVPKEQANEFKRRFGAKSLGHSPLYVRKAAGQFDENKHKRDAGKFSARQGAGPSPKDAAPDHLMPSKITPTPDEKTSYYADELKKKYGDKVLEKIAAVKAKYASDPAKLAALEQVEAKLTAKPPEAPAPSEPTPEFNLKPKKPAERREMIDRAKAPGLPSPLKGKGG